MMTPADRPHEHFCALCFGRKTNGMASGWWRCRDKKCVRPSSSYCREHTASVTTRKTTGTSKVRIMTRRCDECGVYPADPPSRTCTGCDAYREHQS